MAAKLPTAQPANADFFGLIPGVPFTTAVLSGNHTSSVTTITLTATVPTDWPTAGAVYIDNECITYTGKSGADLTGATRGAQGTTAAAHTDATTVRCGLTKGTINQLIEELIQMSKTGSGAKGADVASAAALNIGEDGHYFHVTGTTTITSIEARLAGQVIHLEFDGALTLTHNATSLILQGGTNLTTAAGDMVSLVSEGSGNWRELSRRLASATSGSPSQDRDVTEAEVVNTTTETTVYSYSVPGGTLSTNKMLRLTLIGDYLNNSGAGSNLQLQTKYGATVIGNNPSTSIATSANRRVIRIQVELSAANATNAQRSVTHFGVGDAGTAGTPGDASALTLDRYSVHNAIAEDSTAAKTLAVTVTHGTAAATISLRVFAVQLELI